MQHSEHVNENCNDLSPFPNKIYIQSVIRQTGNKTILKGNNSSCIAQTQQDIVF